MLWYTVHTPWGVEGFLEWSVDVHAQSNFEGLGVKAEIPDHPCLGSTFPAIRG